MIKPPVKPATVQLPVQDSATAAAIEEALKSIRYGVVQLIIQDGRIIQIDKTEKIRLV